MLSKRLVNLNAGSNALTLSFCHTEGTLSRSIFEQEYSDSSSSAELTSTSLFEESALIIESITPLELSSLDDMFYFLDFKWDSISNVCLILNIFVNSLLFHPIRTVIELWSEIKLI